MNSSGHSLLVNGVSLPWSPSIEFVGSVFDLTGHSGKSAEHRQLKANGVFRSWAPILTSQSLPIRERMKAFRVSVANSALWLAGCWTLTKTQSCKLGSWSARLLCRMVSCMRRPDETPVEHWCRHRKGHDLALSFGLDLPQQCLIQKHRLVGHFARSAQDSLAHSTLIARDLGWWRHAQAAHAKLKDKWRGVHSQRFNVWRWESPLESFYGRVSCKPSEAVTSKGWLLRAQDRVAWKKDECAFGAERLSSSVDLLVPTAVPGGIEVQGSSLLPSGRSPLVPSFCMLSVLSALERALWRRLMRSPMSLLE